MTAIFEPRVLRCPEIGILIEVNRARVWSTVVTRTASLVFVKKLRSSFLDLCAADFEYPQGVAQAAERMLHPRMGVATVTDEAKLLLENIMYAYAINTNTSKVIGRFPDSAQALKITGENPAVKVVSSPDELAVSLTGKQLASVASELTGKTVSRFKQKEKGAAVVWEKLESSTITTPVTESVKSTKRYKLCAGADFSKRKGGFRLTLDAFANGCYTAAEAWEYVKKTKPDYKLADIYSDISMARKYQYLDRRDA